MEQMPLSDCVVRGIRENIVDKGPLDVVMTGLRLVIVFRHVTKIVVLAT
jgi:hypothetical protein